MGCRDAIPRASVSGGAATIDRVPSCGDEKSGPYTVERRYGRFERSVVLPQSVDTDKVSAKYENGVLTLELPKSPESRKRKIAIDWRKNGSQKRIEARKEGD